MAKLMLLIIGDAAGAGAAAAVEELEFVDVPVISPNGADAVSVPKVVMFPRFRFPSISTK